ncbi:uncharacterized protein LTR77_009471 [Saxophila tyrrhenica]|uniref:Cytochrome P450 monooxygenase n=1 Tax=Saxophila tyrrhenica TaxID=1690608 RepID=A0AAV9NYA8_9PEZI|nr:hypothetical protein LTR77_009471 [Saxophila tyrrhenica]
MALLDSIATDKPLLLPLLALGGLLYAIATLLYRLFFSPLAKILGPWLTRISTLPEANALKENRRAAWVTQLFNENPGAVAVRTGPNAVSFNTPEAVKAIYGHGKTADGFGKSGWYDAFSTTGDSLFSTRSTKRHAMKRRMVSHGFSMQSLQTFEPIVDATLEKFMAKMDEFAEKGEAFDIYFWYELFTMDLLGELALGKGFGALDGGKPVRYSSLVEQSQRFANHSGLLPFGKWNVKVLSWVPLPNIQKLYKARLEYLDYAKSALERRFQENRQQTLENGKVRQDIMQRFIEAQDPETGHRMDFDELRAETSSLMVAGASTGSVTMNWMTYYLCKNPTTKSQLLRELQSTFPSNPSGHHPLPFTTLRHLRLLDHIETECLRLHPPIGYATPRDTPRSGAVICGVHVPGGVAVGVPAATLGRNASVYPNPDVWDPDRWEGGKNATDLGTMKTSYLGFGHGSRHCIGINVAKQFIQKMIAQLVLRYEVELEEEGLMLKAKEFTIQKPDRRYNVVLKRRGDTT